MRYHRYVLGFVLVVVTIMAFSSLTAGLGRIHVDQPASSTTTVGPTETVTTTSSSIIKITEQSSTLTTITTTITQSLLPPGTAAYLAILFGIACLGCAILVVRARRVVARKKYCTNCGAELKRGEEFCTKCGAKQPSTQTPTYTEATSAAPSTTSQAIPQQPEATGTWLCRRCGTKNLPEHQFCVKCGTSK